MTRPLWYDRNGQPIPRELAAGLLEDDKYRCVAYTTLTDGRRVSTIWLGLDHDFSRKGPPLIFESAVIKPLRGTQYGLCEEQRRYATEAEARAGHREVVLELEARRG